MTERLANILIIVVGTWSLMIGFQNCSSHGVHQTVTQEATPETAH